jgi:hypothetical protein
MSPGSPPILLALGSGERAAEFAGGSGAGSGLGIRPQPLISTASPTTMAAIVRLATRVPDAPSWFTVVLCHSAAPLPGSDKFAL